MKKTNSWCSIVLFGYLWKCSVAVIQATMKNHKKLAHKEGLNREREKRSIKHA